MTGQFTHHKPGVVWLPAWLPQVATGSVRKFSGSRAEETRGLRDGLRELQCLLSRLANRSVPLSGWQAGDLSITGGAH